MNAEIRTDRLVLTPTGPRYALSTHAYAGDPEHTRYMMNLPNDSPEETAAFLRQAEDEWKKERPSFFEFAVLLDGTHIGAVSAWREEDGGFELGWIIHPDHTGRGYALEAARALMDWCVDVQGAPRIIAHCDAENAASARLMEKLGLVRVAACGGRHNRGSDEERTEWIYEWVKG